jgi:hypothetical protein
VLAQHTLLSESTKLEVHFRLLTLREAQREFGLSTRHVYWGVGQDMVHQVKAPGGKRTLYPEWELRALKERLFTRCFITSRTRP